ncbi:hypothetical protein RCH20_001022 [Psychrobacter sp. PL15]|uniref:hypothetical protein n=1 Tax=Psychrobacter sp. PL15 TaxID=3071719 RepID=UPI002DFBA6F8|nr:hypothetical protein [Psychrobacter sp. PL15]
MATANAPTDSISNDDVAVASANGNMVNTGTSKDDVAVATAEDGFAIDDSEILDGTETEEYISTY